MAGMNDVIQSLKKLVDTYKFNVDTLSNYLKVDKMTLLSFSEDAIFYNRIDYFVICNKILFLELCGEEEADLKFSAFLQVLIDHHNISLETIALMSKVRISDVTTFLENYASVSMENRYKIAKTIMGLRFFLKELEP
jgi:hypothetical protein